MTRGARRAEPEVEPWLRPDVQANRVASANWEECHPGLCYEFGDQNSDPFIPNDVVVSIFMQDHVMIALWQENKITTVEISRNADDDTPDWCDVMRYDIKLRAAVLTGVYETEPNVVTPELFNVLCAPLGYALKDVGDDPIFAQHGAVHRVLIEFPLATETEPLPFDTSLSALGALAYKEYQDTIYGSPKV